jgi:hypothetical protein
MAIFDKKTKINANNDSGLLMKIMFWVVLIIFSIVKTKIVHYSSLTYFPLTYIAVRYLLVKDFTVLPRFWKYIQMLSGLPIVLATLLFPWFIAFADVFTPYIDDPFAVENFKIDGGWTGFETLIGVLALFFWVKMILSLSKQKWLNAVVFTYLGMILIVQMTLFFDVPKLEKHIQGALIEFLKSKRNEKCIVRTINFKSYAQYFYAEVKEGQPKEANQNEWLLNGNSPIPIYLITKADRDEFRKHEKLRFLYEKGGFIFYERIF